MRLAATLILLTGIIIAAYMIYTGIVSERFRSGMELKVMEVRILESVGMNRMADEPRIEYAWSGDNVIITFLEDAPNPCYKHELRKAEKLDSTVSITLELKETSEVCIQVLGMVRTKLLIGPIQPSTKIIINGEEVILQK